MLPGPILRREMKAAASGRHFVARTLLATVLGGAAVVAGLSFLKVGDDLERGVYDALALWSYAVVVLAITVAVTVFWLALAVPMTVAPSIAEEREKDTLPLLLLTRLTRLELIATKLAGRLIPSLLLVLTGLPLLLFGAWVAGLPTLLAIEAIAVVPSTAAVAGSLAILASSRRDRTGAARQEAFGWTMIWLGVLPTVALMPVRSGTLWGEMLTEVRRLASWIAPSSPLSLVTNPSWLSGRPADAARVLSDRLLVMLALQAVIIVAAVAGAVAALRLREPHPRSWDPHRGYRPPVGDDPIFWREYVLPWRGSRQPAVVMVARRLLIVLRAVVLLAIQAAFLAIAVAIPIALVIAAGWYGTFAFREWWGLDAPPAAAMSAIDQLNLFIRAVTFMLGLLPMLLAGTVADRIMIERSKKTWEPLLTTPMTGAEILSSKMRVVARGIWAAARGLVPLWLLGIACGALHPLGVLATAAGLAAGTWLSLAMGVRAAIRPGATTRSVNTVAALWSLTMMVVGGLTVIAPLCSGRDLDRLRAGAPRLPGLLAFVLVAALIAMAALARSITRRCFDRFDEWVGRPHRAATAGPAGRAPAVSHLGLGDHAVLGRDSRPASSGTTSK